MIALATIRAIVVGAAVITTASTRRACSSTPTYLLANACNCRHQFKAAAGAAAFAKQT
jgi:hypothetical protein